LINSVLFGSGRRLTDHAATFSSVTSRSRNISTCVQGGGCCGCSTF